MFGPEIIPQHSPAHATKPVDGRGPSRADSNVDETLDNIQLIHRIKAVDYTRLGIEPDFDRTLRLGNKTPQDFVMLFTEDLHPVEPANLFLFDRCCKKAGNNKWQETQKAYADDLAQWWMFLRYNRLAWDEVTGEEITTYANVLSTAISTKTARQLAPATINRRVGTVEEFYRWAFDERLVPEPVVAKQRQLGYIDHDQNMLAHVGGVPRREKNRNRPKSEPSDEKVNPIFPKDLKRILVQLGSSPYKDEKDPNDTRPVRDRLIAETSVYTGMRVEEVVGLTSYQILNLRNEVDEKDPWKPVLLHITVTKGAKPRKVVLHSDLLKALLDYIDGERDELIKMVEDLRLYDGRRGSPSSALFLNGKHSNHRDIAGAVSKATAMRDFTDAVRAAGLLRQEICYEMDPNTGAPLLDARGNYIETTRVVPKHTFHDLRHTFAVQFYRSQLAQGVSEPIKKLQTRLGHAWLNTTERIYLRHFDVAEHLLTDEYARMLKRQIDVLP